MTEDRDNRNIKGRPDTTYSIAELKELYKNSTPVVAWYAHPDEVRGPFGRWLTVSEVPEEYKKHVGYKQDDASYAAAAMNMVPHLIDRIEIAVEALNAADLGLATALELGELECRGDEDCDHCVVKHGYERVIEAWNKIKDMK